LYRRAAALNPLDLGARQRTAFALLALARRQLIDGQAAEVEVLYERNRDLLDQLAAAGVSAIRAVAKMKLGQPHEAAALRDQALAVPDARLAVAFQVMVDSQLAKLKPADKRAAEQCFAAELILPTTPVQLLRLLAVYDSYRDQGLTYRGQKGHEKKVLDLVPGCWTAAAPEADFERLCVVLTV